MRLYGEEFVKSETLLANEGRHLKDKVPTHVDKCITACNVLCDVEQFCGTVHRALITVHLLTRDVHVHTFILLNECTNKLM